LHTSLETTDIFRGAFFMCMGGDVIRFVERFDRVDFKEAVKRQFKEIGILNTNGKEHFYGCAVFPTSGTGRQAITESN
jgi:DNA primase